MLGGLEFGWPAPSVVVFAADAGAFAALGGDGVGPEQAARRECIEELGVELEPTALVLEEHLTSNGGGLGHLKIVRLRASSEEMSPNGEISEARWVSLDLSDLPAKAAVSKWVHSALEAHAQVRYRSGP